MAGSDLLNGSDNWIFDDDDFENVLSSIDFPMESLDLDGGDWGDAISQDRSIPINAMQNGLATNGGGGNGNNGNGTLDFLPSLCVPNSDKTSKSKPLPSFGEETSGASNTLQNDPENGLDSGTFRAPSPNSVLENSSSCSVEKSNRVGSEASIAVRRSKRVRVSSFKLQPEKSDFVKEKPKKKKNSASPLSGGAERMGKQGSVGTTKCTHCGVAKTPQWREGPMGPRTLCNACGVRYKSGRLFPEYRPALSPTFDPSVHSNSHKKVIGMRSMLSPEAETAETDCIEESPLSGGTVMKEKCIQGSAGTKKCTNCGVTKTLQWREGPMGPSTLCNACSDRYKFVPLFPEYPPVSSPTVDPSLHSNSHNKVIEIRKMPKQEAVTAETDCFEGSSSSGGTVLEGKCIQGSVGTKKCTHCGLRKTSLWREGPMGRQTLCNACGVRYKSGRLFPEYRPASSPTFDPSLHSNSHKMVLEMRNIASQEAVKAETDAAMSPPPEFVPMSDYLFD